jgi:hypothetical protein
MAISDPNVLFHAYVELANKSTEVVWARNAAMLIANSFLIAAMGLPNLRPIHGVITGVGMSVCVLWAVMTWLGWEYYYYMHDFITDAAPNLVFVRNRYFGDWILICNMLLILAFFVIYYFAWKRPLPPETPPLRN